VHLLGNLAALAGKDAFNGYADALARNPVLKFIEIYLLLAGVGHAAAGLLISWRKRSFIAKAPAERGMLLFTSLVSLIFIIIHLMHFRLSELSWYDGILNGLELEPNRDLFTQAQELLANPAMTLFYCTGVVSILWHVHLGWERAVKKIDLPTASIALALMVGNIAVWILGVGFLLVIAFFFSGASSVTQICQNLFSVVKNGIPSVVDVTNFSAANLLTGAFVGVLFYRLCGGGAQANSSHKAYGKGPFFVFLHYLNISFVSQ
jgi:hypothetical protein